MKGRLILVLVAVATWLVAIGCAMWPADAPGLKKPGAADTEAVRPAPPADLTGLPFRGIVLQVQRIDSPDVYYKAIDDIVAVGADTVEIVVDSKQENGSSGVIFIDMRQSPTLDKLIALIKYAKNKHLRVVLMPLVLLQRPVDNQWRGVIKPENWDEWFESYREMVTHYATAAAEGHADVFIVGSELVSTERFRDEWVHTIRDVRKIFHGLLTYSANWDHYRTIPFWDQLDIICTNSYWKLGENHTASVEEIVGNWRKIQKDLLPWIRSQHKPYMFTEVGWCSVANAAHEPWDYTKDGEALDLDLQRKLYAGFFEAWRDVPELGGYNIWQWTPNGGGVNDRGYTPAGKPAEDILRAALARPRWKVNVN